MFDFMSQSPNRSALSHPLCDRMYPLGAKIYQNIFEALDAGVIAKHGNPSWDATRYRNAEWNGRHMIKIGGNGEAPSNGLSVTVPKEFNTIWLCVPADRWAAFKVSYIDGAREDCGIWVSGYRKSNTYDPTGAAYNGAGDKHYWVPIPAGRAGNLSIVAHAKTNNGLWLCGLAFSKNPWGHAAQPAIAYHWALNGGSPVDWLAHNWINDQLAKIPKDKVSKLCVPVYSGKKSKILYIADYAFSKSFSCKELRINGKKIEPFMATRDDPFVRHWAQNIYFKYHTTVIPADYIPVEARFIDLEIDQRGTGYDIQFCEIGTYDTEVSL